MPIDWVDLSSKWSVSTDEDETETWTSSQSKWETFVHFWNTNKITPKTYEKIPFSSGNYIFISNNPIC